MEANTIHRGGALAIFLMAALAAWAGTMSAAGEKTPPGKEVFLKYNCNSCHSIQAQAIEVKKGQAAEEDEEEAGTKEDEKKKPPDLSGVGLERKAEWITKYLKKLETIDGAKHRKKFRGKDSELKLVTDWLAEQKKAAPKAAQNKASGSE